MELTLVQVLEINSICDRMLELIDSDTLEDILEEPFNTSEGVLGNDEFFESPVLSKCDFDLVGRYAHAYLMFKHEEEIAKPHD